MIVSTTNSLSSSLITTNSISLGNSSYVTSPTRIPRCLPRPYTSIFVTAGKPAYISAASTSSHFSGLTIARTMITIESSQ